MVQNWDMSSKKARNISKSACYCVFLRLISTQVATILQCDELKRNPDVIGSGLLRLIATAYSVLCMFFTYLFTKCPLSSAPVICCCFDCQEYLNE